MNKYCLFRVNRFPRGNPRERLPRAPEGWFIYLRSQKSYWQINLMSGDEIQLAYSKSSTQTLDDFNFIIIKITKKITDKEPHLLLDHLFNL